MNVSVKFGECREDDFGLRRDVDFEQMAATAERDLGLANEVELASF